MRWLDEAEAEMADVIAYDLLCRALHRLVDRFAETDPRAASAALDELSRDIASLSEACVVEPFDARRSERIVAAGYDKVLAVLSRPDPAPQIRAPV